MATSLDGFITDSDGSTGWVLDNDEWERLTLEFKASILGRTTFEEVKNELLDGIKYFVLTTKPETSTDNIIYCTTPKDIIQRAEAMGIDKLLLSGGGETNYSFAEAGLINEVLLSLHPLLLQSGKNLFGKAEAKIQLKTLGHKDLNDGIIQMHYKVL